MVPWGQVYSLPCLGTMAGRKCPAAPSYLPASGLLLGPLAWGPSAGGKLLEPGSASAPVLSSSPALCPLGIWVSCLEGNLSGPRGILICPEPNFRILPVPRKLFLPHVGETKAKAISPSRATLFGLQEGAETLRGTCPQEAVPIG